MVHLISLDTLKKKHKVEQVTMNNFFLKSETNDDGIAALKMVDLMLKLLEFRSLFILYPVLIHLQQLKKMDLEQ